MRAQEVCRGLHPRVLPTHRPRLRASPCPLLGAWAVCGGVAAVSSAAAAAAAAAVTAAALATTLPSCHRVRASSGGNVLVPLALCGTAFALIEEMAAALRGRGLDVPIYVLSPVASACLTLANVLPEWVEPQRQVHARYHRHQRSRLASSRPAPPAPLPSPPRPRAP